MLRHAKDVCPASLALSGSLWLSLARCPALSGSLWLSLAPSGSLRLSLALSGSLWLSQAFSGSLRLSLALYCSPNLLTKPLLGSQGPCSALSVATAIQRFSQPCISDGIFGDSGDRCLTVGRILDQCCQQLQKCTQGQNPKNLIHLFQLCSLFS